MSETSRTGLRRRWASWTARTGRAQRRRPAVECLEGRALLAVDWQSAFGLATGLAPTEAASTAAVAIDDAGNTYVVGNFRGTTNFGGTALTSNGASDIFVARYDANNQLTWVRNYGDNGDDTAYGIAVDNKQGDSSVYVIGSFSGTVTFGQGAGGTLTTGGVNRFDGFLLKLSAGGGQYRFVQQVQGVNPGAENTALGVTANRSGEVAIAGQIFGPATIAGQALSSGVAERTSFTAKFSTTGNLSWASTFAAQNPTSPNLAKGVALDPTGAVIVTGQFSGTVDFDPGAGTLVRTSDSGTPDIYVVKLAPGGATTGLALRIGAAGLDVGEGVATDDAGNIYVTGKYTHIVNFDPANASPVRFSRGKNAADVFLAKYSPTGVYQWVRSPFVINDNIDPGRGALAVQPDGTAYFAGSYQVRSQANGYNDNNVFVAQVAPDGRWLGLRSGGSSRSISDGQTPPTTVLASDVAQGLAVNASGQLVVSGISGLGNATFGSTTLANNATTFVARLTTNNVWKRTVGDFDGDGITDTITFQPTNFAPFFGSTFFVASSALGNVAYQFGIATDYGGTPIPIPGDYDGDGRTDMAVYQPFSIPSIQVTGSTFYLSMSAAGNLAVQFGDPQTPLTGTLKPAVADYDADGKTDVAVFAQNTRNYRVKLSGGGELNATLGLGTDGELTPAPGRYVAGNAQLQPAVYSATSTTFYRNGTAIGVPVGSTLDARNQPVPADYDGDGLDDFAVFSPATRAFTIRPSSSPLTPQTVSITSKALPASELFAIPGDYDGDGDIDPAFFDRSTSTFYTPFVLPVNPGGTVNNGFQFGVPSSFGGNNIPVVGDYDGDGKTDVGVFDKTDSIFYLTRSSLGQAGNRPSQFGIPARIGGRPLPLPLVRYMLYRTPLY